MSKQYTLLQISTMYGVHLETVRRWVRAGKLKAHREVGRGRLLVVDASDLEAFIQAVEGARAQPA